MKLLVTGGAGFIGSNFIRYWLRKYPDDTIVNLDKLTYAGNLDNLKPCEQYRRYTFVKGDIGDANLLDRLLPGTDAVIHFAAESHVDRSIQGPAVFFQTNVAGTQTLLDACVRHHVPHFHHISTDEVFGSLALGAREKFTEETAYDPRSPYAASKAAADHLVRAYGATYGLPYTITNCSNNFGPYQHPEKFLPVVITSLLQGKKVPVYGDGKYVRDWLYVEDHVRAIDAVLEKGKKGETYCIGGNACDIDNLGIVKKVLAIMGRDESAIAYVKDRPGHDRRYAVGWLKAKEELGWEPLYDFDTWLGKTVQWYKDNAWWWKKLLK